MINIIEMILMGIFATLIMDLLSIFLGRLKIIRQLIEPQIIGRWILYSLRGKFTHGDIHNSPALRNEKAAALLSHYVIGVALAGIYLLLESEEPSIFNKLWAPLVFGVATVILPWLWLYPSIGLGFLASRAQKRSTYVITSLVNHTNFGLGLVVWFFFLRRYIDS